VCVRRHGFRLDHFERKRKKEARKPHELAQYERKAFGLKAKLHHKKRHQEKVRTCAGGPSVCPVGDLGPGVADPSARGPAMPAIGRA
jgi:hypothetical protein